MAKHNLSLNDVKTILIISDDVHHLNTIQGILVDEYLSEIEIFKVPNFEIVESVDLQKIDVVLVCQLQSQKTIHKVISSIINTFNGLLLFHSSEDFSLSNSISAKLNYKVLPFLKREVLLSTLDEYLEFDTIKNAQAFNKHEFLILSTLSKIELVKWEDILYFEADGRCTKIYLVNNTVKVSSKNLGSFEGQINPHSFYRVHHRFIVNLKHISYISKQSGYYCMMINGANLPISTRKKETLLKSFAT